MREFDFGDLWRRGGRAGGGGGKEMGGEWCEMMMVRVSEILHSVWLHGVRHRAVRCQDCRPLVVASEPAGLLFVCTVERMMIVVLRIYSGIDKQMIEHAHMQSAQRDDAACETGFRVERVKRATGPAGEGKTKDVWMVDTTIPHSIL
jgi:hypothetical protein